MLSDIRVNCPNNFSGDTATTHVWLKTYFHDLLYASPRIFPVFGASIAPGFPILPGIVRIYAAFGTVRVYGR